MRDIKERARKEEEKRIQTVKIIFAGLLLLIGILMTYSFNREVSSHCYQESTIKYQKCLKE